MSIIYCYYVKDGDTCLLKLVSARDIGVLDVKHLQISFTLSQ
jgi:hypothetical protein